MNIQKNKEDSDLSSDSSWTFINDPKTNSRKTSFEKVSINNLNGSVTKENLEKNLKKDNLEKNLDVDDTSFVNVDEFSWDRFTECGKAKPKVKKNGKKKHKSSKKCYEDPMNVLTITACLLTIIGITILTTLLPPNYTESVGMENLKNHLAEVYKNSNIPTDENTITSLQATREALDSAVLLEVFNKLSKNMSDEEVCEVSQDFQNNSNLVENYPENFKLRILTPYVGNIYSEEKKLKNDVNVIDKVKNKTKSYVEMAKDLIKSPSLQIFVATLVQDLCLIKLINEFTKATTVAPVIENKESETAVTRIPSKSKKPSGFPKKTTKKTSNSNKIEKPLKKKKSPKNLVPKLSSQQAIKNIESFYKNQNKDDLNENGKSECERRFEELDTRGTTLGYNHWQKIQQIKNKFQKEIFQIKEQEKTNYNRSQKVQFTREKFLQRLKSDREIYLQRLRKIREERKKLLDDVCHGLNSNNLGSKDASVGNFAVLIPESYYFSKKIEYLKNTTKEENNVNLTAFNNETISYEPYKQNTNEIKTKAKPVEKDWNAKDMPSFINGYCELKRKYLRKKAKVINKRKAEKDVMEIQDVVKNIIDKVSKPTPKSSALKLSPGTSLQSTIKNIDTPKNQDDFQIVHKKKTRKRNLNKLYQAAFDEQSKKIKENDEKKWRKTNFDKSNWVQHHGLMTKQDPLRTHKLKIIHKGVL